MMISEQIYNEAARWLARQYDENMDWDGFTLWLEAHHDHRIAFNELASIDAHLDQHSPKLFSAEVGEPANNAHSSHRRRWAGFGGGAIAAGVALVLALQPARHTLPLHNYRSMPGQTLTIALGDGAEVFLAPASRLTVDGSDVALQGTAFFDIPHKPGRVLTISSGEFKLTDIGTRFSVANESDGFDVEVAQGSLSITSDRLVRPITLGTGQELRSVPANGTVRLANVNPQQIATWRSGKLQFEQVPLARVARDISRYSGERVTVDPAVAGQPFSGVIAIGHGEAPARTLAQILSLNLKQVDGGLRLEPHRR